MNTERDPTRLESTTGLNDEHLKSGGDHVFTNASSDGASKQPGTIVPENRGPKGEGTPSIEDRQDCSTPASLRASRRCGGFDQEPRPSDEIAGIGHPAVNLLGNMNEQTISQSSLILPDHPPFGVVHDQFASNSADFAHSPVNQSALDLKAAFLPLIPHFAVGSAGIRVWIHTVKTNATLTTPPYVRASVHSGGSSHCVTCTSLSRGPTPASLTSGPASPTERNATQFSFEENEVLLLGVEGARELSCQPIMLRLQAVSNRLLGSCDVSLVEALRRPGSVFQEISMPIWRTVSNGRSGQVSNNAQTPEVQTDRVVSGYIVFDFGVMLKQEGSKIPAPKLQRSIPHAGIVKVSVTGLRRNLASGSDLRVAGTAQCTGLLGVSVMLGSSSQHIIATFDTGRPGSEQGHWLPTSAVSPGLQCTDGSLVSTCIELDILILRLVYLKEGSVAGSYAQGRVLGSHSPIPISDISNIFGGATHWMQMSPHASSHRKRNFVRKSIERAGRDGWDVCLRVAVSMEALDDQMLLREGPVPKQASPRPSSTLDMSQYSVRCTESSQYNDRCTESRHFNSEDWILAQGSNLEQAQAALSSHPKDYDETVMVYTEKGSRQGPGHLYLELLAVHGSCLEMEAEARNGLLGDRKSSPRFWVHASFSGGSDGLKIVDSSYLILGDRDEGQVASTASSHKIARWPLSTIMVIKYALHCSPRQRILPMASFRVFHENVSQDRTQAIIPVNSDTQAMHTDTGLLTYPSSCYFDYLSLSGLLDGIIQPVNRAA